MRKIAALAFAGAAGSFATSKNVDDSFRRSKESLRLRTPEARSIRPAPPLPEGLAWAEFRDYSEPVTPQTSLK
jgi:hypothetical protein